MVHHKSCLVLKLVLLLLLISLFLSPALAKAQADITYIAETNTIEVKKSGSLVNLTEISGVLRNDNLLVQERPRQWLLKANLKIFEEVRLELHGGTAGGDVDWLKLKSNPDGYVNIESFDGQISIRNTRITSWDEAANTFDTKFLDSSGRAFISAKNRSSVFTDNRMDVIDSEVAYLGFFEETAYGISWKVLSQDGGQDTGILGKGMTGTVTGSKFHHNYFGMYVWGVGDMQVINNEFYENYRYGFDAHTITQRVLLENNYSHDNGSHGMIFAERCTENVIRNNRSINNQGHGIMLHERSDNNIIESNEVEGNDDGIPVFQSSNNTIRQNILRDNNTGLRVYGRDNIASSKNLFDDNEISGNAGYGVYMYDEAVSNTLSNNRIFSNRDFGIYLAGAFDNVFTANEVSRNPVGVRIDAAGQNSPVSIGNRFTGNTIQSNQRYGVYSYPPAESNSFVDNTITNNGIADTVFSGTAPAGGGGRSAFETVRLILIGAIIAASLITLIVILLRRRPRPPLTASRNS